MRRLATLMLAIGLIVAVVPLPASAARVDAAGFAADCNDDGKVDVSGTLKVVGGAGLVTVAHCDVFIDANSKLVFRNARVKAAGELVSWGDLDSTLKVFDSRIVAEGLVELKTTCCFDEPGVPVNGLTKIVDSTIRGSEVYLSSATAETGGTLKVRRSTVRADLDDVTIPVGGLVQFTDNVVNAGGDLRFSGHDVRVRRNNFTAVAGSLAVSGSVSCVTSGNTPAVTCT